MMCFLEETLNNNEVDSERRIKSALLAEYGFENLLCEAGCTEEVCPLPTYEIGLKSFASSWMKSEGREIFKWTKKKMYL